MEKAGKVLPFFCFFSLDLSLIHDIFLPPSFVFCFFFVPPPDQIKKRACLNVMLCYVYEVRRGEVHLNLN